MKIVSWNVNGIRSACRKGFLDWLNKTDADIVCLQEIKAQKEDVAEIFNLDMLAKSGYELRSNHAEKKGYSGVAVLTRKEPLLIINTLGVSRFDSEGRILELKYPEFTLLALYLPHGGRLKENLPYKLEVYSALKKRLEELKNEKVILAGDFNIAHDDIDLARPKDNRNNIMFTAEERSELDRLISMGFTDSFRKFDKENGNYTWWPYRNGLRERNIGWRIDYIFASNNLSPKLKDAFILKNDMGSDHCPIGAEFDI
jgi:exodeoxyribonuclease-3